ncbi:hypothetical protein EC988_003841 [Linderina pennispora]|nr:hypothetical protein EC988_003841 [Linderina pennispora]
MATDTQAVTLPRGIECLACTRMFGCLEDVVEHISSNSCPLQPQLPVQDSDHVAMDAPESPASDMQMDAPGSPASDMQMDFDIDAIVSKLNSDQVDLFISLLGDQL